MRPHPRAGVRPECGGEEASGCSPRGARFRRVAGAGSGTRAGRARLRLRQAGRRRSTRTRSSTVEAPARRTSRGAGRSLRTRSTRRSSVDPTGLDVPRCRRVDRRLHRRPAEARRRAGDRARRRLRAAPPAVRGDPRVVVSSGRTRGRSPSCRLRRGSWSATSRSSLSGIALPPVLRLCAPGWQAVVLVKPQFEAGREDVGKGGVVRDDEVRRRVVREVADAALGWQASVAGVVDSGTARPEGKPRVLPPPRPFRAADSSR